MGLWLRLIGTVGDTFRIGFHKAVVDSTALTAERVYDLPDKAGTFALLDDVAEVQEDVDAITAQPRLGFWLSL